MDVSQWEPATWIGVLGGIVGIITALTALVKVIVDRRAGIDSKEVSESELELSKGSQAWSQLVEITTQLRTDLNDARTRVSVLESKIGDQAVEIASRIDEIREKDARIGALNSDIVALLEHIHAGRQPPPPKLRGYRGEEETR